MSACKQMDSVVLATEAKHSMVLGCMLPKPLGSLIGLALPCSCVLQFDVASSPAGTPFT